MAGYDSVLLRCISYAFGPFLLYVMGRLIFNRKRNVRLKRELLHYAFAFYVFLLLSITIFPIVKYINIQGTKAIVLFFQSGDLFTISHEGFVHEHEREVQGNINLIPLKTVLTCFNVKSTNLETFKTSIINVLGVLLLYAPFGMVLPILYKKFRCFLSVFILTTGIIVAIELIQFLTGRSADIDDYLLGIVGCSLGYLLFKLYQKKEAHKLSAIE